MKQSFAACRGRDERLGLQKASAVAALPLAMIGLWSIYLEYGDGAGHRAPVERRSKAPAAAPSPGVTDEHGAPANLDVELVPDSVLIDGKSEAIEYHAEITSHISRNAAVAWSAAIIDDRGMVVRELASGEDEVEAGGVATTPGFVAPQLPNGFYMLRIRAALVADDFEDTSMNAQFLRVRDGLMRELSAADWYETSQARLAVQVAETNEVDAK